MVDVPSFIFISLASNSSDFGFLFPIRSLLFTSWTWRWHLTPPVPHLVFLLLLLLGYNLSLSFLQNYTIHSLIWLMLTVFFLLPLQCCHKALFRIETSSCECVSFPLFVVIFQSLYVSVLAGSPFSILGSFRAARPNVTAEFYGKVHNTLHCR